MDSENSALSRIFSYLDELEPPSAEQERALASRYLKEGDQRSGRLLVLLNLRLAVSVAEQYKGRTDNFLDLIQQGVVGLLEALERFDLAKGYRFVTYANYWVRAKVLEYVMEDGRLLKVGTSRPRRTLFFNFAKARRRLEKQGFEPTPERIADLLGIEANEVRDYVTQVDSRPARLDASISEDGEKMLKNVIPAETDDPEDAVSDKRRIERLSKALKLFGEQLEDGRKKSVWFERMVAIEPKKLREFAGQWDISKQRVHQIESEIRSKFRLYLKREFEEEIRAF